MGIDVGIVISGTVFRQHLYRHRLGCVHCFIYCEGILFSIFTHVSKRRQQLVHHQGFQHCKQTVLGHRQNSIDPDPNICIIPLYIIIRDSTLNCIVFDQFIQHLGRMKFQKYMCLLSLPFSFVLSLSLVLYLYICEVFTTYNRLIVLMKKQNLTSPIIYLIRMSVILAHSHG